MAHAFLIDGAVHEVWLSRTRGGYELHSGRDRVAVALRQRGEHVHDLVLGDADQPAWIAVCGDDIHVHVDGEAHVLRYSHSLERFADQAEDGADTVARAPMPGAVISVQVEPGQSVHRGDVMMVIESMKMETSICAGIDGTVQAVHAQPGQTFERDALLVTLQATEAAA